MSTTYLWDASNYDDPITVRDGIDGYTHKIAEGHHFYRDVEYRQSLENARSLGIPILGAYFVNHPGDQADQVDWYVQLLDQDTPWWRTHPCFIHEIDAEKFSYMPSAPTLAEIQAFGDRLVRVHGVAPSKILAYAPQWLYGNTLAGLTYRLWASAYGANPYVPYRDAYPGNDSPRWQSYSGQSPLLLQYGSNTTIGNQTTCDANAYRGTLSQLLAELGAKSSGGKVITIVPGPNNTLWKCDGMFVELIPNDAELANLRYIAKLGAIQLWHDPVTGSDIWNGGIVPAFGVDVATLGGTAPPIDTAPIEQAAHDGAKAGASEAIDGATIHAAP